MNQTGLEYCGLRKVDGLLDDEGKVLRLLCLRLAVIKCHARQPVDTGAFALKRRGRTVELSWPQGWGQAHPRTLHQLRDEAENWLRNSVLALALPSEA